MIRIVSPDSCQYTALIYSAGLSGSDDYLTHCMETVLDRKCFMRYSNFVHKLNLQLWMEIRFDWEARHCEAFVCSLSVLKHLFVNFCLLCENTKASKPIVNVLSRICGERKDSFEVILKAYCMQFRVG